MVEIERKWYSVADAAARVGCTEADVLHLAATGKLQLCFLLPPGNLADRFYHVGMDRPSRTETAIDPHDFVGVPEQHARHLELRGYAEVTFFIDLSEPGYTWWPSRTQGSTDRPEITIHPSQVVVRASDLQAFERVATPIPSDPDAPNEVGSGDTVTDCDNRNDDLRAKRGEDPTDWFDPATVQTLETLFPANGKWKAWAARAASNGLQAARVKRGQFNPHTAGRWFLTKKEPGWTEARLYRVLANNLPARSKDKYELLILTGAEQ